MKVNKKRNIIISVVLSVFAIVYTLLVKFVDVKEVGPNNSKVGFANLNKAVFRVFGENIHWYNLTKYLGYIFVLIVLAYAVIGIIEIVKRKSLFKVDKELLVLGCFYVVIGLMYVLFEKVIVNYRPILVDGVLEASYPSSHTMITLCVCGSAIIINSKLFKNNIVRYLNIALSFVMILMVIGRTLSGVHWFTDIVGGVIISSALLMIYYTIIDRLENKKTSEN